MNPEFIIRIIVRARNEIAGILDKAASDVDKVTHAEERHATQSKKTQAATRDLRQEFEDFTASVKRGEKTTDDAVYGLRRFSSELDRAAKARPIGDPFGEEMNRAAVAARRHIAEIQELERARTKFVNEDISNTARLTESRIKQSASEQQLRSDVQKTIARFDEFQAAVERGTIKGEHARLGYRQFGNELSGLSRKFEAGSNDALHLGERAEYAGQRFRGLGEDVKRSGSMAERANMSFRQLLGLRFSNVDDWEKHLKSLEARLNSSSFSVAKLDNRLRGLIVGAVFAFFQQLVSVTGALVGSLISVASAAIQAGEALGGALVAGAAQAIPMIGLLVAAWGRVGAVFKAVQQAQKDALRSTQEHQQASDAARHAADSVRSAEQALADANRRSTEAQQGLTKARRDATRQLQDLIDAEIRARLEAQDADRQRRRDIEAGNVDAQTANELRAQQARTAAARASQDLGLAQSGDPTAGPNATLIAAQRQVEDAARGIRDARSQLENAKADAATAATKLETAHVLLEDMLRQLTPTERRLYEAMRRVQETYHRLFRPITDIIVGGFTSAVDRVGRVMSDPRVIKPLTSLAEGISKSIGRISRDLTGNRALNFFRDMAGEARKNLPIFTSMALHLEHMFENIARAGSPALHTFLQFLDDLFAKGDRATGSQSGIAKLTNFFNQGEKFAEQIIHLGGAIFHLFGALIGASAQSGATAIEDLTTQINKATAWIESHQRQVKKFFDEARKATYEVAGALWSLIKALGQLYNPGQVHELAKAFSTVLLPVLVTVAKTMGTFVGLILKFMGTGIGGAISRFGLTLLLLQKTFSPLITIFGTSLIKLAELAGAFGKYRVAAVLAATGTQALEVATGPLGIALAAITAAVLLLNGKFHFLHYIGEAIKDVFNWFGGLVHHNPFLEIVGGVVALTAAIKGLQLAMAAVRATSIGGAIGGFISRGLAGRGAGGVIGAAERAPWAYPGAAAAGGAETGALAGGAARAAGLLTRGLGAAFSHAPLIAAGAAVVDSVIEGFKTHSVSQGAMRGLTNVANTLSFGLIPKAKDYTKIDKAITDNIDHIEAVAKQAALQRKLGIDIPVNIKTDKLNKDWQELLHQIESNTQTVKAKTETWSGYFDELKSNVGLDITRITYLLHHGKIDQGQATAAMAANFNNAANSIQKSMEDAGRVTKQGLELMNHYLHAALKDYGMSEADIKQELTIRDYRAAHGAGTGTGAATLATGGFVGMQGERGRDKEHTLLGRGEAVLGWMHQKIVEPAMNAFYGFGLSDMFRRTRGYHAGGPSTSPGYAVGRAGLFDGHPGNVAMGVRQLIETMKKHFPLTVTSTTDHSLFTTSGNISDHSTGHAVDLSGPVKMMFRAAEWIKSSGLYRQLKQGIHNPNLAVNAGQLQIPPGQFAGAVWGQHLNHIHLAIAHALSGAFGGSAADIRRLIVQGPDSPVRTLVQRSLDIARRAARTTLSRATASGVGVHGEQISSTYAGPLDRIFPMHTLADAAGHVRLSPDQVMQIARSVGFPARQGEEIAHGESDYYPGIVSWDKGYGLMQMTPRVWGAAAKAFMATLGGLRAMLNPVKNFMMAKYLYDSAGHTFRPWFGTQYLTYARGGELPGQLGQAMPIIAHAREWILPEHMQHKIAGWIGTSRDRLKGMLGFAGGPHHYQAGGEVGGSLTAKGGSRFTLPENYPLTIAGITEQAQLAIRFLQRLSLRSKTFLASFSSAFQEIAGDGGLLDQLADAYTRMVKNLDTQIKRGIYKLDRFGRVLQTGTDVSRAENAVTELEKEYGALVDERGVITGTLARITERIRRLRRGGITAKERSLYNYLEGFQRKLRTRLEDLQSDIADNLESRFNAVEAALQARVDEAGNKVTRVNTLADLQRRGRAILGAGAATAIGLRGPQDIAQQQVDAMQIQVAQLRVVMMEARRKGHTELAQKISDQIDEVNQSIAETIQKGLQDAVDEANARAQHTQTGLDLRGRLADLMEKAGDSAAAFAERGRILADRGTMLGQQITDITGLRDQAAARGQTALVNQLNDQLAELAVQVKENTAAIDANTIQARQARIDAITGRGGFLTGVYGGLGQLLTAIGANTGVIDVAGQTALLGRTGTTLKQTGQGLAGELFKDYGVDVRGLSSSKLVDVLSHLNYDGIEANFSPDQKSQFEQLINSIIENATALEGNTQQLQQLNSPKPQNWSSTAWTWFRNAIFTGSGGLLPQYQIPHAQSGGMITRSGLLYGHQGERVVAAGLVRSSSNGNGFHADINVKREVQEADPQVIAHELEWLWRQE